jgi:WhiB family transcriptional regulator, redox-sensing transcriptional regulator
MPSGKGRAPQIVELPKFAMEGEPACKGMDTNMFFPKVGESAEKAKAVCATCPIQEPCREHAIEAEKWGLWGGLAERERRRIRYQRRREALKKGE